MLVLLAIPVIYIFCILVCVKCLKICARSAGRNSEIDLLPVLGFVCALALGALVERYVNDGSTCDACPPVYEQLVIVLRGCCEHYGMESRFGIAGVKYIGNDIYVWISAVPAVSNLVGVLLVRRWLSIELIG